MEKKSIQINNKTRNIIFVASIVPMLFIMMFVVTPPKSADAHCTVTPTCPGAHDHLAANPTPIDNAESQLNQKEFKINQDPLSKAREVHNSKYN